MKTFFDDNVFLNNSTAATLYDMVRDLPVYDYHCHLSPKEIYEDKQFDNISQLWLYGDHYKWRLMRQAGVDERLITGDASDHDKFVAFATVLPLFCGNPVYHWAHMELVKYFNIRMPISATTAEEIWQKTSEIIAEGGFSARSLIVRSGVTHVVTTDEITSDLSYHKLLADSEHRFAVRPGFRCDKLMDAANLCTTLAELEPLCGRIDDFDDFVHAIEQRAEYFNANVATVSDVSLGNFPQYASPIRGKRAFAKILEGDYTQADVEAFRFNVLVALGKVNTKYNWAMQLHCSVMRNNSTRLYGALGRDVGGDSVAEAPNINNLKSLLDTLDSAKSLPKTVVYTMCEAAYQQVLSMLGSFAGEVRGKLQLGAAWWFCDSRDGITRQLKAYANGGGLGMFNGMLTDSRSFTSYARHDFFRRVLCSVVGEWVENGELPLEQAEQTVANVCYNNALSYFGK